MGEVVPRGTALPQGCWKNLDLLKVFLELSMESPLLGESIGENVSFGWFLWFLDQIQVIGTIDEQLGRYQSFGLTKATWKTGCQAGEPAERRKIGSYWQGGVLRPMFLWRFCVRESGLHAGWRSTKSLDVTKSWTWANTSCITTYGCISFKVENLHAGPWMFVLVLPPKRETRLVGGCQPLPQYYLHEMEHTCSLICIYIYIRVYIYTCIVYIYTHIYIYTYIYIYMYSKYAYIYTYIYIYNYIYTALTNKYIDIYWPNDRATYIRHSRRESSRWWRSLRCEWNVQHLFRCKKWGDHPKSRKKWRFSAKII